MPKFSNEEKSIEENREKTVDIMFLCYNIKVNKKY